MLGFIPLDTVRAAIRIHLYSIRTEEAYGKRVRRYVLFHKSHPAEMAEKEWIDSSTI